MEISLQFDGPGVPKSHKTWFILISKLSKISPINEVKFDILHNFVDDYEDWCQQVLAFILSRKKMSWNWFKKTWLADAFPLDEIGIMFFARCFKCYICILFNTHFWTTHKDNNLRQCSIFLAYRGNMVYEDTVPMTEDEYKVSAEAIRCIQAKFDERTLVEENDKQPLRCSKRKRNVITSDDEELDLEALLEETGKPGKIKKTDNNVQKQKVRNCSVHLESLDSILKHELNKTIDESKPLPKVKPLLKNRAEIPIINIISDN